MSELENFRNEVKELKEEQIKYLEWLNDKPNKEGIYSYISGLKDKTKGMIEDLEELLK